MTKLNGPYASATVAIAPCVNADNTKGTTGKLNVTRLNIAWLVPSSMVSKMTSRSIIFVTRGCHGWNGYERGVVHPVISWDGTEVVGYRGGRVLGTENVRRGGEYEMYMKWQNILGLRLGGTLSTCRCPCSHGWHPVKGCVVSGRDENCVGLYFRIKGSIKKIPNHEFHNLPHQPRWLCPSFQKKDAEVFRTRRWYVLPGWKGGVAFSLRPTAEVTEEPEASDIFQEWEKRQ